MSIQDIGMGTYTVLSEEDAQVPPFELEEMVWSMDFDGAKSKHRFGAGILYVIPRERKSLSLFD